MVTKRYIQNYDELAITPQRKIILELIEAAYGAIQSTEVIRKQMTLSENVLHIQDQMFDLGKYERIFLLGLGKGSAAVCKEVETILGDKLTEGYDIDVVEPLDFKKVQYTKGTHPLPSEENINFTKNAVTHLANLTEKDLVLIVICGGGSVMFEDPAKIDLATLTNIVHALLTSGADITEMNTIRKHLSRVKGGNLAKQLYPATVTSLIFSDVPGNDLSVIASGPTTKDLTSMDDVHNIIEKYKLLDTVTIPTDAFIELPTDDKYFANVHNLLIITNTTAIKAMQDKATELGQTAFVYSDRVQGDARLLGQELIDHAKAGQILLAGGESTIKVVGKGKGGRNQALALCALQYIGANSILASFGSDGWDFYELAGGIVDVETYKKMQELQLDPKTYIADDDSYHFFTAVGDGIKTGKLDSNVSDLYIVWKIV